MVDEAIQGPAEESTVPATLKVKKRIVEFRASNALWQASRAQWQPGQESFDLVDTFDLVLESTSGTAQN